ncbi:MAG: ATP-binding protein [Desulfovermiculus sp.]
MISVHEAQDGMSISFDFPAQLENIEQVCARTEQFLSSKNITAESFDLLLLLREMANNAVIHGCKQNRDQHVHVHVTLDHNNVLHMDIKDQGNGFDWQSRLTGADADSEACSGRGIRIVQYYADSCTFNASGNRVQIQKKVTFQPCPRDV